MTRVLSIVLMTIAAFLFVACGGGTDLPPTTPTPATDDATPTPAASSGTPAPAPSELRIAFINLGSPITVDETDRIAHETFFERLDLLIAELKDYRPDLVAITGAAWTDELGAAAWEVLASELRIEVQYQRANPWFPNHDKEDSDATRDLIGFEEGEALLSRYPIRWSKRIPLNPRTSESEGRIALHAVLRIEPYGDVNVYISRLSGTFQTRLAQAADLRRVIDQTREDGPVLVFADFGMDPDSEGVTGFTNSGFFDLAYAAGDDDSLGTCCRTSMLFGVPEEPGEGEEGPDAEEPVTPLPGTNETPEVMPEQGTPESNEELAENRTLYVFSDSWGAEDFRIFGQYPALRADGSRLYASDHNGIFAIIDLRMPSGEVPHD